MSTASPIKILLNLLALAASTMALTLTWPKYPEEGLTFYLQWSGGVAPYTVYILTPDETKYYYKYVGSDKQTSWQFALDAGSQVVFQCQDSTGVLVTSPAVTVIQALWMTYPTDVESGSSALVKWGGGVSPYKVYALSTDLAKYYWSYEGSDTGAIWNVNVNPGTGVVFQALDSNGVKSTGNTVTVQENQASESSISVASTASVASVASVRSLSTASFTATSEPAGTRTQTITAPSLTMSSFSAGTQSSTLPSSTLPAQPPINSNVFQLLDCSGCGTKSCGFGDFTFPGNATYAMMVGTPVRNCGRSGNSPVTSQAGGQYTVEDTWSVDASVGANLGMLKIDLDASVSTEWSHTTSQSFSQFITITVNPGQQGVVIAYVSYKQTKGKVTLPSGNPLSVVSNQPLRILDYEPLIIGCNEQFPANNSQTFSCSSSGLTAPLPLQSLWALVFGASFIFFLL